MAQAVPFDLWWAVRHLQSDRPDSCWSIGSAFHFCRQLTTRMSWLCLSSSRIEVTCDQKHWFKFLLLGPLMTFFYCFQANVNTNLQFFLHRQISACPIDFVFDFMSFWFSFFRERIRSEFPIVGTQFSLTGVVSSWKCKFSSQQCFFLISPIRTTTYSSWLKHSAHTHLFLELAWRLFNEWDDWIYRPYICTIIYMHHSPL